jgi:salicylate hydroxylase
MGQAKIRVAIAGGGIAGLALAFGLTKKPQLEVHVYEGVQQYLDIGAGLALHPNGIASMLSIGEELRDAYVSNATNVGDELRECSTDVIIAQGLKKGELVAQLGKAKGRRSISRADLLKAFSTLVPTDSITFGKRLQSIDETDSEVHLYFKDGSSASADVLIGADGIRSVARSHCLGPNHPAASPVNHDGWLLYRASLPADDFPWSIKESWLYHVPILIGPRGYFNVQMTKKGTQMNVALGIHSKEHASKFDIKNSDAKFVEADAQVPAVDPALFHDYTETAQQLAALVAEQALPPWVVTDHDPAPSYVSQRGRVCIIGDAAHATAPWSGQGASQALEDASVVNAIFSHVTRLDQITPALKAYDSTRRQRSQLIVEMTRKIGRMYLFAEGDLHEHPDQLNALFKDYAKRTALVDVAEENNEAVKLFTDMIR